MSAGGHRARVLIPLGVASAAVLLVVGIAAAATTPLQPEYGTGTDGTGAGEINSGEDVGLDRATNEIWVPEDTNDRVSVFNRDGSFSRALGYDVIPGGFAGLETCTAATGCKEGTDGGAPGQFSSLLGIEIGPGGLVFTTDEGNYRVDVFTTEGEFLRAFGLDVIPGGGNGFEVCTKVCQPALSGDSAGGFEQPWGMAVSPENELYVADTVNHRIAVYSFEGEFLRALGYDVIPGGGAGYETCTTATGCKFGEETGLAGSFSSPEGLDFDLQGRLWIAEYDGDRVSVLGPNDEFAFAFGRNVDPGGGDGFEVCTTSCQAADTGDGPGEFDAPQGIEVDFRNNVYVGEDFNYRISVFSTAPAFLNAFGRDVIPGGDPLAFEICTTATGCQEGEDDPDFGAISSPYGMEADCHGTVYTSEIDLFVVRRFGEPDASLEPCPFKFGKAKLKKKNGTAKQPIEVPEPGTLTLKAKGIKKVTKEADDAETLKAKVKPKGKLDDKLEDKGKAKVKLKATFDPLEAGETLTEKKKLKLIDR